MEEQIGPGVPMKPEEDLIYDVGMHNGNDTAFYLACGFRVVAIEADPDLASAGAKRFSTEIATGKLQLLNMGIAENDITGEFWINEKRPHFNSFDRESAERLGDRVHPIQISCCRLDQVLSQHGIPYYLKIDIEGNDIVCCDQITVRNKPTYISVEMSRIELLHKLQTLGYNRFKLITQLDLQAIKMGETKFHIKWLRSIYRLANYKKEDRKLRLRLMRACAAQVLEGAGALGMTPWGTVTYKSRRLPAWQFIEGCSGTFGEDLPGTWHAAEEIHRLWIRELEAYEKMGRELWCDLHAMTSTEQI